MSCTRRSQAAANPPWSGWSASSRQPARVTPLTALSERALAAFDQGKSVAFLPERLAFLVAIAPGDVVVDHSGRLHVRVDDRAADEAEAALLEILAERIGLR